MNIYFAPLEGITNFTYRNLYFDLVQDCAVDKFYAPFVSPSANPLLKGKEIRDLLPENNNPKINLIPQILCNRSDYFIKAANQLTDLGYTDEININLGCPSGTVTSKDKGSGFLRYPDRIDAFLEDIFKWRDSNKPDLNISVKTRIGYLSCDEFPDILAVYNRYPISELIIHPRTRQDMYKNFPDKEAYQYAADNYKGALVYNGDINTVSDYNQIVSTFTPEAVMIGRGLIANPYLAKIIKTDTVLNMEMLHNYVNSLLETYSPLCPGNTILLNKMKEFWFYISKNFEDEHKVCKLVRKCQTIDKYYAAVDLIFSGKYTLK